MHIAPSFPNLSVLLIDASPHYRRIIRTMMYQAQLHRIFEASDLSSAATMFIQKQPNIVILDWDLPDSGSMKCLASIRSFKTSPFAKAPVLVMMERPDRRSVVHAAKLGAHEIINKPISPNNLWLHLSGIINIPRKYKEQNGSISLVPRAISNWLRKAAASERPRKGGRETVMTTAARPMNVPLSIASHW